MSGEPPESIYLQWNCEENDPSYGNPDPGDVTWCPDKIFSDDVRYIRDKRYGKRKKRNPSSGSGDEAYERF